MKRPKARAPGTQRDTGADRDDFALGKPRTSRALQNFRGTLLKSAVLAACARHEKEQEFFSQHGPVRVLVKDGIVQVPLVLWWLL